jgi:U3 small nucleolar RNA-associated protein 18
MVKHPRKKQKTSSKGASAIQPLGAKNPNVNLLTDDASKDDEERRLESVLFGTKFVPRKKDSGVVDEDDSEHDDEDDGGREMRNLMDADVSLLLVYIKL